MQYGEVIDGAYDPTKQNIYNLFSVYFNNPEMFKKKDVQHFSMYIVKIHSMLSNVYRYLVAFVNKDEQEIGTKANLKDLNWSSLQTRTFPANFQYPIHSYNPRRFPPLMKKITLNTKNKESYMYDVEEFPLTVTLLRQKPNEDNEYHPSGVIPVALETYQTIVTWKDQL